MLMVTFLKIIVLIVNLVISVHFFKFGEQWSEREVMVHNGFMFLFFIF